MEGTESRKERRDLDRRGDPVQKIIRANDGRLYDMLSKPSLLSPPDSLHFPSTLASRG